MTIFEFRHYKIFSAKQAQICVSANVLRSKFYVCPIRGNVIHSMGEAAIHCHGIQLIPLEAEPSDEHHMVFIERVEDEYYVRIDHSMTKEHYISFVATLKSIEFKLPIISKDMKISLDNGLHVETLRFFEKAGYNSSDKTAFIQWLGMEN